MLGPSSASPDSGPPSPTCCSCIFYLQGPDPPVPSFRLNRDTGCGFEGPKHFSTLASFGFTLPPVTPLWRKDVSPFISQLLDSCSYGREPCHQSHKTADNAKSFTFVLQWCYVITRGWEKHAGIKCVPSGFCPPECVSQLYHLPDAGP